MSRINLSGEVSDPSVRPLASFPGTRNSSQPLGFKLSKPCSAVSTFDDFDLEQDLLQFTTTIECWSLSIPPPLSLIINSEKFTTIWQSAIVPITQGRDVDVIPHVPSGNDKAPGISILVLQPIDVTVRETQACLPFENSRPRYSPSSLL